MRSATGGFAVAAALLLTACGGSDTPNLMNVRASGNGPDEFAILPPKALEMPETLAQLPPPTLGGTNRTDPTPKADAIIALGGSPGTAGGVPATDGALVNYAARSGISADIRTTLAAEDLEFRSNNRGRPLERLFNLNVYYRAYRDQSLDQYTDLARWRRLGARTPSAPPPKDGE